MATITCPNCGTSLQTDEVLAEQVRHQLEHKFVQERAMLQKAQAQLQEQLKAAEAQKAVELKQSLAAQEQKLKSELWQKAQQEAKLKIEATQGTQLKELQTQLEEQAARAKKAEESELELRKQQRQLLDREKQLELEVERKVDQQIKLEREKTEKLESERFSLKEKEYLKQIEDMRALVAEAQRKAHTVSQQLQGEVQELALEQLLHETFPSDEIEEVKKGQLGADIIQVVKSRAGKTLGRIVWESKQTENFSDKWLPKLREDCRAAHGDVAILVSRTLPEDIKTCVLRDQVWITGLDFVIPLATLLRQSLVQVDHERQAQNGRDVKSELLFQYIHSQEFRHRVEAIVESFREMHDDLDREQRSLQLLWKKREKQLLRLATNTAYMYGEIQGLVGASLPSITGLEAIEAPEKSPVEMVFAKPTESGSQDGLLSE